jgi:hypothetical protein
MTDAALVVTAPALTIANVLRHLFAVIIMTVMAMDVGRLRVLASMIILHPAVHMMTPMTLVHLRHHLPLAITMTPIWQGGPTVVLALPLGASMEGMIAVPTGKKEFSFCSVRPKVVSIYECPSHQVLLYLLDLRMDSVDHMQDNGFHFSNIWMVMLPRRITGR